MKFKLEKISTISGLLGLCVAVVGCLGGNALIGASHGILGLSLIFYFIYFYSDQNNSKSPKAAIRPSLLALVLITLFGVISVGVNWSDYANPFKDLKKLRYEIVVILFLVIPFYRGQLFVKSEKLKWIIGLGIVSSALIVAGGIVGAVLDFNPLTLKAPKVEGRVGGVSGSQMTFGYTLQFMTLLACAKTVSLVFEDNRNFRLVLLFGGVFCFLFLGLYFSYCRGALFALGFGILAILLYLKNLRLWVGIGIFTLIVCAVSLASGARYTSYLNSILRGGKDLISGDRIRVNQWKTASLTFLDHPVFGIGHRQFEKQSDNLKEDFGLRPVHETRGYFKGHAHNNFLEAFSTTGVLGGLAFIAFCVFWFYEMYKSSHAKLYFLPIVVAFIISGMFENTFTDSEVLHTILLLYFFSQVALDWEAENPGGGIEEVVS